MSSSEQIQRVIDYAIQSWRKSYAGTSGLDLSERLSIPHDEVHTILERLCDEGKGSLNRNVELYQVQLDLSSPRAGISGKLVKTHVYFPSKELLHGDFYRSDLAEQNLPEYLRRLHLGANQVGLVFFAEEVLTRYFSHPEVYEVTDSLAGGKVSSRSEAPEDRQLYVRYGKSRQAAGQISVTAIYKDLAEMTAAEQRYWHSYELEQPSVVPGDENFSRFLARTYEGECVDYPSPIENVLKGVSAVNQAFTPCVLFKRLENVHLCFPVEQTYKALCDCSSELYKIVGPDAIDQAVLRRYLIEKLDVPEGDLVHSESKRPLSTLQLLALAEAKLGQGSLLTNAIRKVGKRRVDADHKVLPKDSERENYSDSFSDLCSELGTELEGFKAAVENGRGDT